MRRSIDITETTAAGTGAVQPARRGLVRAWAILGVVGLVTGAAYSSGFARSGGGAPTSQVADAMLGEVPVDTLSLFTGNVVEESELTLNFNGSIGEVPSTVGLFEIVLGRDAYNRPLTGDTFFADVYLANPTALGYDVPDVAADLYSHLELRLLQYNGTCETAVTDQFSGAVAQTLYVESIDAHVTFSGLTGATDPDDPTTDGTYCIGIAAAPAAAQLDHSPDETFVAIPNFQTPPAVTPELLAVVNRSGVPAV